MRVAVLGGTTEARELAARLHALPDVSAETSLAGVTAGPPPDGAVRVGRFAGVDALAEYLRDFDVAIDATHPFAARITEQAVVAASVADRGLLVVRRPGWTARAGDDWRRVGDLSAAAATVAESPARSVFLAIGRQGLAAFAGLEPHFVLRLVAPPSEDVDLPAQHTVIVARGPFELESERRLLADHRIDLIVTKDSGGDATVAKLVAARELGIPVVMVDRPPLPPGVRVVDSVPRALAWLVSSSR